MSTNFYCISVFRSSYFDLTLCTYYNKFFFFHALFTLLLLALLHFLCTQKLTSFELILRNSIAVILGILISCLLQQTNWPFNTFSLRSKPYKAPICLFKVLSCLHFHCSDYSRRARFSITYTYACFTYA